MSTNSARTAANRSSRRLATAHGRKAFTGERLEAALAGIGRKNDMGLDVCTPAQRSFRALLALGLFNEGSAAALPARWGIGRLAVYDPVVSPRWDKLVVVAERAPVNIVECLVTERNDTAVFSAPGLRLESWSAHDEETFRLRHQPTGARLVVTGRPAGPVPSACHSVSPWRNALPVGEPLTDAERRVLDSLPRPTADAQVLLAGLVTRYTLVDRRERWATSWSWDPLDRGDIAESLRMSSYIERRLWGDGDSWELRWTGYPYPADLARALTHPTVGIPGADLHRHRDILEVTYGSALLEIREWRA